MHKLNTFLLLYQYSATSKPEDSNKTEDEDEDNFEDAEEDEEDANTGAIGKQLMQNGLQSPDSGIHADKSATELTLSA